MPALVASMPMTAWPTRGRACQNMPLAPGFQRPTTPRPAAVRERLSVRDNTPGRPALHTITVSRMRSHPPTLAYIQRRTAEGKSDKEIRRCVKRYLARHLYRTLSQA